MGGRQTEVFIIGAIHITFHQIIERDQMPEQPPSTGPPFPPPLPLLVVQLNCLTKTTSQLTQSVFVMRNVGQGLGKSNIPLSPTNRLLHKFLSSSKEQEAYIHRWTDSMAEVPGFRIRGPWAHDEKKQIGC